MCLQALTHNFDFSVLRSISAWQDACLSKKLSIRKDDPEETISLEDQAFTF